jgi:putative MATE family efflux protein
MRHVVVMTATGSVGLVAIFAVDFLNLFYISLLGEQELAAAIGYAGSVLAFNVAIGIGVTIAASALVSRALGAGDRPRARRLSASALVFTAGLMLALAVLLWPVLPLVLDLLGAEGRTKEIAVGFLRIVVPSMPVLGLGMALAGLLRAVGDARRAMYVTLAGGIASAALDPLFIFGLDLGVTGAAIATVLSRCVLAAVGWHGAARVHGLVGRFEPAAFLSDVRALSGVAVPAVLANVATPVGNAYVTAAIARFGDDAVAGWAIIGRVLPLAFGPLFALSGAVGPIIGQNFGAGLMERVRGTLRDALLFTTLYTLAVWGLLVLLRGDIAAIFGATGDAAALVVFFCTALAGTFVFSGALFVANASFNNLGFAAYSTIFNWGRATLGTISFVWLGARWGGAEGALAGWALGGVVFGLGAGIVAFRVTGRPPPSAPTQAGPALTRPAVSPLSSGKSHLG